MQAVAVLGLGELVVRAAGDGAAAQPRNRLGVQRAADRARRVDVALGSDHIAGRDDGRAGRRRARLVDVGDEHLRAVRLQERARDRRRPSPRPARGRACRRGPASRRRARRLRECVQRADRRAARAVAAARPSCRTPTGSARRRRRGRRERCSCRRRCDTCRRATRRARRSEAGACDARRPSAARAPRAPPCRRRADVGRRDIFRSSRLREPHRVGEPVGRRAVARASACRRRRAERRRMDADEHPRAARRVVVDDRFFAVPCLAGDPRTQPDSARVRATLPPPVWLGARTKLIVKKRETLGSRETRRLRRRRAQSRRPLRRWRADRDLDRGARAPAGADGNVRPALDSRRRDRRHRHDARVDSQGVPGGQGARPHHARRPAGGPRSTSRSTRSVTVHLIGADDAPGVQRGRRALAAAARAERRGAPARGSGAHRSRRLAHGRSATRCASATSRRRRASRSSTTRRLVVATITAPTREVEAEAVEGEEGEAVEGEEREGPRAMQPAGDGPTTLRRRSLPVARRE